MGCEGVKGGGKKRGRTAGRQVNSSAELDGEGSVFIFGDNDGERDRGSAGKSRENVRE